jgi:hypothetical protein
VIVEVADHPVVVFCEFEISLPDDIRNPKGITAFLLDAGLRVDSLLPSGRATARLTLHG